MHGRPMLTLPKNRSRSSKGHDLYTHCSTLVHDASCQVSLKSIQWFSGSGEDVTWIIYKHIDSFAFDWPKNFREEEL